MAGFVAWQVSERVSRVTTFNGANRRFTGSYEATSFPKTAFPRDWWFNDNPSQIDRSNWTLSVTGTSDAVTYTPGDLEPDVEISALSTALAGSTRHKIGEESGYLDSSMTFAK